MSISNCCSRRCKSSGGYIWRYQNDPLEENFEEPGLPKEIDQYSLEGEYTRTYPSISEAARDNSIASSNLVKACKKIYKQTGGFIWRYQGEEVTDDDISNLASKKNSKVRQLTLDGTFEQMWNTIKEAAEKFEIHSSSISAVCAKRKHFKSAGGFKWEYA